MPTLQEIGDAWILKGYGVYHMQNDDTLLLFHHSGVHSFNWHIHIGDDGQGGWAVIKTKGQHSRKYRGLTNATHTANQWADFLWKEAGYDSYTGTGRKTVRRKRKNVKRKRKTQKH
jgi:hypothetical protein